MVNFFRVFVNIHKKEIPFTINMFSYFFLVTTSFWILKTLKKGLFFEWYKESGGFTLFSWTMSAARAELLAKILNMLVSFAFVGIFGWLSQRVRREKIAYINSMFFLSLFFVFSILLVKPIEITTWLFYIFGDLFSTVMVATFFVFLNDSVSAQTAKRLYGPIGLGGLLGGVFGASIVNLKLQSISLSNWMWICFVIGIIIMINAYFAAKNLLILNGEARQVKTSYVSAHRSTAYDGVRLTFKSPYLLSILGIVALYEIVSALMDFQFSATIEHFFTAEEIPHMFAKIFTITNSASLLVQIFLTSLILTRFGMTPALLTLPGAVVTSSILFFISPRPLTGSFLNLADNAFSYSINQSAKEALYVPTNHDEKYKAKTFIDMFVQRLAKTIAVVISFGITIIFSEFSTIRWISLLILGVVLVWIRGALHAGNTFTSIVNSSEPKSKTLPSEVPGSYQ